MNKLFSLNQDHFQAICRRSVSPGRSHAIESAWYDLFVSSDTVASLYSCRLGRAPHRLQSVSAGRRPGRAAVSFLSIFGPNFGHETTNFEQNLENFLKKKCVETTSGFNETCQMTAVVSKKLVKIQNTLEN